MDIRRIVFWQATPSPHMAAFIRTLATLPGIGQVQAVYTQPLQKERLAMGWREACFGGVDVHFSPDEKDLSKLIAESDSRTVHVFSEFITDPTISQLFWRVGERPSTRCLISEGRDWRGIKGMIRKLHRYALERPIARRSDFLLAIGHMAREWYGCAGFPPDGIFDFSYVVELPSENEIDPPANEKPFRLLFVGQLIPRKGMDILLESLSELQAREWELQVVGDGPEFGRLTEMARHLGLADRVQFLGVRDNEDVRRILTDTDLLVLPSRWDGWGAVVNEALMSGTRVVCSDFCGAAELIKDTPYGGVFACDSASSLASVLDEQIARGSVQAEERAVIKAYSDSFAAPAVARYFVDIIDFRQEKGSKPPTPPWKTHTESQKKSYGGQKAA